MALAMLTVCTLVEPEDRAGAEVLATSIQDHQPDARRVAFTRHDAEPGAGWPSVVALEDDRSIPSLLRELLADADVVAFAAPTIWVQAALTPMLEAVADGGVAVCPRTRSLPDDGCRPGDSELLAAGAVSDALVVARAGAESAALLDWWAARADDETPPGRWLELASHRFDQLLLVDDPGCDVSAWNLHERVLTRDAEQVRVDGVPLRFIDFAGFRADQPYWLSADADRVRVVDDPILSTLCGAYAQALRASGWSAPRFELGDAARLGNGQRVDHLVRALWEQAERAGEPFGDPRAPHVADAFVAWMRAPAEWGGRTGVNRYLLSAYDTRPDLQRAFPDLDGDGGDRLVLWSWEHGRRELLPELLPQIRGSGERVGVTRISVNVIGYLGETLGLAEAARGYIEGLAAARVPVSTTAITPDLPVEGDQATITRYGSYVYQDRKASEEPAFNLACLNGDHLANLIRRRGIEVLAGRPTIGQWGWETDVLPPSWQEAFPYVDEVWVYSTFMAENLGRLLPMPVVVVPPAVVVPDPSGVEVPIAFDERFTFLFMFDLFSTERRKNALGLVEAFTRAFAPGEGPRLLVKTINARFRERAFDELRARAHEHPDVEFVDLYLEPIEKTALLARADCYVSLHRSEGFGLPLAEAMALGTPVVCTGYSGNLDFTTPFNSYLVDWRPTRVGPDTEVYPPDGTWAEPDLDHAAEQMRRVWRAPEEAARRAERARGDIHERYDPGVVGQIARGRLERLADRADTGVAPVAVADRLERVREALRFDLRNGAGPTSGRASALARKLILRSMLPFTFHEREIDRALLDAIAELSAEVQQVSSRRSADDGGR